MGRDSPDEVEGEIKVSVLRRLRHRVGSLELSSGNTVKVRCGLLRVTEPRARTHPGRDPGAGPTQEGIQGPGPTQEGIRGPDPPRKGSQGPDPPRKGSGLRLWLTGT